MSKGGVLKKPELLRALKGPRLMLNTVEDGRLWASNSYWAVDTTDKGVFTDLFGDYNLTPEPMVCDVGPTIRRTVTPPPDIQKLIPSEPGTLIAPWAVDGCRMFSAADSTTEKSPSQLWRHADGRLLSVSDSYVTFVERFTGPDEFTSADGKEGILTGWRDGVPVALLMPIRSLFSGIKAPELKRPRVRAA